MFTITGLYERVNELHPIDRATFDKALPYVILDLYCLCGKKYLFKENAEDLNEDFLPIKDEYYTALLSGILYLVRGDKTDAERAHERAFAARDTVWRKMADEKKKGEKP